MKKRSLSELSLNKKTISNLQNISIIGGASDSPTVCQTCIPGPVEIPTIDIPTINDSCFSLCRDKCNNF